MSVDQMAGYMRQQQRNTPGSSRLLPDWIGEGFQFPPHPKERELIGVYERACSTYLGWCEISRSAVVSQMDDPNNEQKANESSRCLQQSQQAKKALADAERSLKQFVSHSPEERITLYESEISDLEV